MTTISYLQAIRDAQLEEMRRDERVFIMGEDVAWKMLGSTEGFVEEFGAERVRNTPITEAAFTGAAAGAAMVGMRPIVDLMLTSFMYCAMDQIISIISKSTYLYGGQASLPLTIRASMFYGGSNAAQHSDRPIAPFMASPGLKIIAPSSPYDAKGLLKAAIRNDNPVAVLEHKALYFQKGVVPEGDFVVPLGRARVVREGRDVTIISYSKAIDLALAAAGILAGEGVEAEVIDLRSLKPLDLDTMLASVAKTNRAVVVHEAHRFCGFGAELAATIQEKAFHDLDAPVQRVAALDVPIPFSRLLEEAALPQVSGVTAAVRATF